MANKKPVSVALQETQHRNQNQKEDEKKSSTGKRHKRFGNRGRTGCKTCRARHMKCDENRPVCKRCITGKLKCEYSLPPPSTTTTASSALVSIAPLCQTEPPDWDLVEGFRYFLCYMVPRHAESQTATTDYAAQFHAQMHVSNFHSKSSFLMITTCNRITVLCATNGRPARPGEWAAIQPLWEVFYGYMGQAISNLNRYISEKKPIRFLLYRVIDILSVELSIIDSPWRAHIGGFLGIVDAYGGVDGVMKSSARPPILALQFGLIYGTVGNACSPSNDQIPGFDAWSDAQVVHIYTHTHFNGLPCPSRLFLAVRQITRLRVVSTAAVETETGTSPPPPPPAAVPTRLPEMDNDGDCMRLYDTAASIATEIHDFIPSDWTERHDLPDEPLRTEFASIFKHAVILYALLSLPERFALPFTAHINNINSDSSISDTQEKTQPQRRRLIIAAAKRQHRSALLALIDKLLLPRPETHLAREKISFPLAVLGAACYRADDDDQQARVLAHLEFVRTMPASDCGAVVMLNLLPRFWAARSKGTWEDCFYTSCQVMA